MSVERLNGLQDENDAAGLEMMQEAGRFSALASRHEDGTAPRAVASFNLFQTPEEIAARMAAMLPTEAKSILEPSVGLGRLYTATRAAVPGASFVLVENSPECMQEVYRMTGDHKNVQLLQSDFLECGPAGFDAVIMNPPFKMGRDIKHIMHALEFLKPGGLLVSLCYDGTRQNAKLRPLCDSWEVLPAGAFKSEGTNAGAVLLTIRKGGAS